MLIAKVVSLLPSRLQVLRWSRKLRSCREFDVNIEIQEAIKPHAHAFHHKVVFRHSPVPTYLHGRDPVASQGKTRHRVATILSKTPKTL